MVCQGSSQSWLLEQCEKVNSTESLFKLELVFVSKVLYIPKIALIAHIHWIVIAESHRFLALNYRLCR